MSTTIEWSECWRISRQLLQKKKKKKEQSQNYIARDDFDLMTISSIQTFYTMMDGFEKSRDFTQYSTVTLAVKDIYRIVFKKGVFRQQKCCCCCWTRQAVLPSITYQPRLLDGRCHSPIHPLLNLKIEQSRLRLVNAKVCMSYHRVVQIYWAVGTNEKGAGNFRSFISLE